MMINFICGIILGVVLSTIGVQGVANILDRGVHAIQVIANESQKQL
jgi:hypothetical protein